MFKVVKIGDKEVPMMAMASADIYYKRVFGEDPLKIVTEQGTGESTGLLYNMGFILAKQAELRDRKKMLLLNEDAFIEWLEQFEYSDYLEALTDIASVYYGNKAISSQEKKENGQ